MSGEELLGEAVAPSGVLLLVDPGLLNLWFHDRPPLLPPGSLPSRAAMEEANTASDIEIVGDPKAELGRVIETQTHSRLIYDVPRSRVEHVVEAVALAARRRRIPATARRLLDRIPHRRRADLAVADGRGAGIVPFGAFALAAASVAPRTPLMVAGERATRGRGIWSWIEVRIRGGKPARRETVGRMSLRRARCLFIDADAAGAWVHDESLDGLADVVFWGADAPRVAARTRAKNLGDGNFGWIDIAVEEAERRRDAVAEHRRDGEKFMLDYRPHSHHHALLAGLRQSGSEACTLDIGKSRACGYFTGRGEGEMAVTREVDDAGQTLTVRVNLASADSVRSRRSRMR